MPAELWGQDTVQAGTFWGVLWGSQLNLLRSDDFWCLMGVPTDPLEEVMILGVSRGGPTNPVGEVMFFYVSPGLLRGAEGGNSWKCSIFVTDRQTKRHFIIIYMSSLSTTLPSTSQSLYIVFVFLVPKSSFCVLWSKKTGSPPFLFETKFSKNLDKQYQFTERKKIIQICIQTLSHFQIQTRIVSCLSLAWKLISLNIESTSFWIWVSINDWAEPIWTLLGTSKKTLCIFTTAKEPSLVSLHQCLFNTWQLQAETISMNLP